MGKWRKLIPHADYPMPDVHGIEVVGNRIAADTLSFRFILSGDLRWLELAEPNHPSDHARRDELWRTTCFEAFVRIPEGEAYIELNTAPTGDWAAYEFEGPRRGMINANVSRQSFRADPQRPDWYDISADFRLPRFLASARKWSVGLNAIIEAQDGTKSYWALAHAPGPPDFHNPACFIATLPAPEAP